MDRRLMLQGERCDDGQRACTVPETFRAKTTGGCKGAGAGVPGSSQQRTGDLAHRPAPPRERPYEQANAGPYLRRMSAPRLPAMFSLFRQRQPRGFDLVTRYYDPIKEARDERLKRMAAERDAETVRALDREMLSARMRHSWHTRGTGSAAIRRFTLALALVLGILYVLARHYGLLNDLGWLI